MTCEGWYGLNFFVLYHATIRLTSGVQRGNQAQSLGNDLDRSFQSYAHMADWSEDQFAAKKNLLADIITALLKSGNRT